MTAPEAVLDRILREIKGLPTLPHIYQAVSQLAVDPETSAAKMARAIQGDPSISAKILGLVNSPYYGLSGKVGTITHAVALLGFKTLQNVVLSASIVDLFKAKDAGSLDLDAFWRHSVAVACTARLIARTVGLADSESHFVIGLLHDIGKLVESQFLGAPFREALARTGPGKPLHEAEREVLGFSHDLTGRKVLERWRLPEGICHAVGTHHAPSVDLPRIREVAPVHVADILCIAAGMGSGGNPCVPPIDHAAWDALALRVDALEALLDHAQREAEETYALLKKSA